MLLKKYFFKTVNRISDDFKQKELLPLKLVFFVQASTISVLYPYLTIHMRELGINVEEAAIMSAVIPIIGIFMPPLAGMVADKIGNFKLLLALFSLIGGAAALLLLLVPVGRVTVTHPDRITLSIGCNEMLGSNQSGFFEMGLADDVPCNLVSNLNASNSSRFSINGTRFEGCGFVCRSLNQSEKFQSVKLSKEELINIPKDVILSGRSYVIQIKTEDGGIKSYHYNLTLDDVPKAQTKEDILSHRIMANDMKLRTSIRKLAPFKYFFPAMEFSKITCKKISNETTIERTTTKKDNFICYMGIFGEEDKTSDAFSIPLNKSLYFSFKKNQKETIVSQMNQFVSDFVAWSKTNETEKTTATCKTSKKGDVSVFVYLHNPENNLEVLETLPLSECQPKCLVSTKRKSMCTNMKEEVLYDPKLTFWVYLVIRIFIGIIGSTSYAMFEVAVIAILREQKADYGLQRIYASIGGMISSPLSGLLIDYASQGKGYTDFRPAFYLYAGLKISTSLLVLFINLEFKKAASNVVSDVIQVLKNLEIIALLIVCFSLGTAWGYIESFLFWFLEDLGGSRSLMGITITVGGIAGIPLLVLSGPIIKKIGHANVLFLGFLFYGIRLTGYSFIYNPYHCLFFEAMEAITASLSITAAVTYAAKLSTTTTDGSIQGLVGGLYFGVGRGAGSLVGGYLMKAFGTRQTYRIFAVGTVLIGFLYYFFNEFYISKRAKVEGNDICPTSKPTKNNSDVLIITQKPKDGGKRYGTIQLDNNNLEMTSEKMEKNDEEKKEKPKMEKESFNNPAYVPDSDEPKKTE